MATKVYLVELRREWNPEGDVDCTYMHVASSLRGAARWIRSQSGILDEEIDKERKQTWWAILQDGIDSKNVLEVSIVGFFDYDGRRIFRQPIGGYKDFCYVRENTNFLLDLPSEMLYNSSEERRTNEVDRPNLLPACLESALPVPV